MLGVSVHTIQRRMDDIGLRVYDLYSTLSDNKLDMTVNEILIQFPNTGYRMMIGHLKDVEFEFNSTGSGKVFTIYPLQVLPLGGMHLLYGGHTM